MAILSQGDTLDTVILKMAQGAGGSMEALRDIVEQGPDIDPEMDQSGIGHLLLLDKWGIYGSDIYILFCDKCGGDVRNFLLLLRATQIGEYPKSKLKELAGDQFTQVHISDDIWQELDYIVCRDVPRFREASPYNTVH